MEESCKNCVFLLKLNAHPWNGQQKAYGFLEDPIKFGKGAINEQVGYICSVGIIMAKKEEDVCTTFFDFDSGMCELFASKESNRLTVKVENKI